jgi:integrase
VLDIVDVWLCRAEIGSGPVFRGVYKGGESVRDTALTTRAVRMIMKRYLTSVDGEERTVRPHDLRRTYARRMFEAGVELLAIQQNLGHRKQETTEHYIGELHADRRRAPELYDFDLDDAE